MKFCPLFWQRKNPSSPWSKLAKSRPLTGTLIWSFIVYLFSFLFSVDVKFRAPIDDRQVT
jgi:hypothetical protein